jgi:hypothetical protein
MNFTVTGMGESRRGRAGQCSRGSAAERLFASAFDTALEMGRDKLDLATCEMGLLIANII